MSMIFLRGCVVPHLDEKDKKRLVRSMQSGSAWKGKKENAYLSFCRKAEAERCKLLQT